jgi:iron(III) transport system ATP-binding protein
MNGLVISDVWKSFGTQSVLRGVDLEVPAGSLTAMLGPSGSGKTTLLRIVAGFDRADRGSVSLGGTLLDGPRHRTAPEHRKIGYVPQEGALFPHLTVGRNVAFGVPRAERRSGAIGDLLELVGMRGMGHRYPHELSGGQQQRVALARALAVRPELVLLDEPFSSLDAALRAAVRADVRTVLRRAGTTALLVTHDQDEALSWADHVAVIGSGRIAQMGTPEHLYARPADPDVARFVGDANLISGRLAPGARTVDTALGSLEVGGGVAGPAPSGGAGEVTVLVRPEQVVLVAEPGPGDIGGRVASYEYFGHDAVVRVETDLPAGPREVVVRTTGGRPWTGGTRVGLAVRGPVLAWAAPEASPTDDPASPKRTTPA